MRTSQLRKPRNTRLHLREQLTARWQVLLLLVTLVFSVPPALARELPADPLESVMWKYMADRFFAEGELVFDQRVKVSVPHSAEDQFFVPVTVDASSLDNVVEIVALADLNPIPHILSLRPIKAEPYIAFRVKLQQATPIRVGVRTADGQWHINGAWVDAAGGGCTAPAMAHGLSNWIDTLGHTRAIAYREPEQSTARLSLRMRHPMDTGLADGIPAFYLNELSVVNATGEVLAELDSYEPVSENPTFTLKPLTADAGDQLMVKGRDNEGNEFELALAVTDMPAPVVKKRQPLSLLLQQ